MPRIVVCEDDAQVARFLALALRGQQHVIEVVHTAETCLAACAQAWPQLIVTDLTLPDMDGCTLIRRLRLAYPTLPILAISGANDDVLQAAWESGADRVMAKPLDPGLLQSVAAHLIAAYSASA